MAQLFLWLILIYSLLVIGSGVMDYRLAGSRPALIAGNILGGLLVAAWLFGLLGSVWIGLGGGLALALTLFIIFTLRFIATRQLIPAGVMALVSFVVVNILIVGLFGAMTTGGL